jgi:Resolvase, N terminal domain
MAKAKEPNRTVARKRAGKGQLVGNLHFSTLDQNEVRQLEGLKLDKTFTDKASGKDAKRPQLEHLLSFVREGDTVFCHSLDRLARNLDDLRKIVLGLRAENAQLKNKDKGSLTQKVSEKGVLSLYGMGRFPVTSNQDGVAGAASARP